MYLPELFRVEDVPQMHALMRARPFAALVSAGSAGLFASHLPTVLKDEGRYGVIECHLARANPHWRDLVASGESRHNGHPKPYIWTKTATELFSKSHVRNKCWNHNTRKGRAIVRYDE